MLQFMGSQKVIHNLVTEQQQVTTRACKQLAYAGVREKRGKREGV